MSPAQFRTVLAELGFSQVGFARWLQSRGYDAKGLDKTVRNWCQEGGNGPPGPIVVILSLLREHRAAA